MGVEVSWLLRMEIDGERQAVRVLLSWGPIPGYLGCS